MAYVRRDNREPGLARSRGRRHGTRTRRWPLAATLPARLRRERYTFCPCGAALLGACAAPALQRTGARLEPLAARLARRAVPAPGTAILLRGLLLWSRIHACARPNPDALRSGSAGRWPRRGFD